MDTLMADMQAANVVVTTFLCMYMAGVATTLVVSYFKHFGINR